MKSIILSLAIMTLLIIPISVYSYSTPILMPPVSSYRYNEPVVSTIVNHGDKLLIIISNWPFIVQGNVYHFQLRAFDQNQVTITSQLQEFYTDQGNLGGVSINATLFNYDNSTVLKKWSGTTNQFGWFEGSVLMENETPDKVYHVVFIANYPHMVNSTKTFSFELVDHREVGESG